MNEATIIIDQKYRDAVRLNQEILTKIDITGQALFELAKSLKQMRDSELYTALGYDSFDTYCVDECGFKKRMAYNYISVLEKHGSAFLQSNAKLGVTKLEMLTDIPIMEREEFVTANNVEDMSARELKEAVDRATQYESENLSLMDERDEISTKLIDAEKIDKASQKRIVDLQSEANSLKKKIKELENQEQPQQLNLDEEKNKISAELENKFSQEKQELKASYDTQLKQAEERIKEETDKRQLLEQQQIISADTSMVTFKLLVGNLQDDLYKLLSFADEQEDSDKYKKAVHKLCGKVMEGL